MKVADLHEAFTWVCDGCGIDNYARGVELDPESELAHEANRECPQIIDGVWCIAPITVTCVGCGETYATQDELEIE